MKRILVIGCSGSGKTTLSRWLARRLNVPLVVLDAVYWKPGWQASPEEDFRKTVRTLADREAWVMDGTYHASLSERLPIADTVVWLDFPRWRCLSRVILRSLTQLGSVRSDMAPGCPERMDIEFLRYVWRFNAVTRPRIGSAIEHARHPSVIVLRSPREVSRFRSEFHAPA